MIIERTARNFVLGDVTADSAYGSVKNTETPANLRGSSYFMYRREEFLEHYHKRSNVETTFSMIKRKFGDSLRSKTDTAQVNETLAKVLCHNLVVLIHEVHELEIDPVFWRDDAAAAV